jgi:hypothetical protein
VEEALGIWRFSAAAAAGNEVLKLFSPCRLSLLLLALSVQDSRPLLQPELEFQNFSLLAVHAVSSPSGVDSLSIRGRCCSQK